MQGDAGTYPPCQRRSRSLRASLQRRSRVNLFTQLANDATHLPPVRQAARKYCYAVSRDARKCLLLRSQASRKEKRPLPSSTPCPPLRGNNEYYAPGEQGTTCLNSSYFPL